MSEYVDLGAVFAAEGKDSLNAQINTFWAGALAGFAIQDGCLLVHIPCDQHMPLRSTLVGPYLANVVAAALEHKCPPTPTADGPCINGYTDHDWDRPAGRPPTVCIRCDIPKPEAGRG